MIAQPWEPVPPHCDSDGYAQVHHIANALVAGHHTVQLCAAGAAHCDARIVLTGPTPDDGRDAGAMHSHLMAALQATRRFQPDVVHDFTAQASVMLPGFSLAVPLVCHISAAPGIEQRQALLAADDAAGAAGVRQVLVADDDWVRAAAPGLPWHAVIPRPVALTDTDFSTARLPYLVYTGPLDATSRIVDVAAVAHRLGLVLTVVMDLPTPAEQAFIANELGGGTSSMGTSIEFVIDADSQRRRRLLSRATGLVLPAEQLTRARHTVGRSLASGTPVLVVGESADAANISLTEGVTAVFTRPGSASAATRAALESIDAYECRRIAARDFSPAATAAMWESLYRDLVARPATQSARRSSATLKLTA